MKRGNLGVKGLPIMISNELKALWANKQIIYSGLLSPVLYFIFFSLGIQFTFGNIIFNGVEVSFLAYSLVGIFAMSLFKEMYQCVYRMITDKRWGLLGLKLMNGIYPPVYIIGISTFPIVGVVVQSILLYCLATLCGGVFPLKNFLFILIFLVFCVVFWSSLLICIALLIKDYKQRDFVMNTLFAPIMFAAPLFYSFDNAPTILKGISQMNPLTYQLQAMRSIAFGMPNYKYISVALLLALVTFIIATICLYHADFQNSEH